MDRTRKNARNKSLLEIKFSEHCKYTNQRKKDVADIFCMSYPTLYRKLHPDSDLQADFLKKLSKFLNEDEANILKLHNSYENQSIEPILKPDLHSIFTPINSLWYGCFLCLCFAAGYFYLKNNQQQNIKTIYLAEFFGSGKDIDFSVPIILNNFHSSLYKYEYSNVISTIKGEDISISGDVLITMITSPKTQFKGKINAKGIIISGKAALSYKVIIDPSQETWVGALMLTLPFSGDSLGYWLSHHNDPDKKSSGEFAMGDIYLKRSQNEISLK